MIHELFCFLCVRPWRVMKMRLYRANKQKSPNNNKSSPQNNFILLFWKMNQHQLFSYSKKKILSQLFFLESALKSFTLNYFLMMMIGLGLMWRRRWWFLLNHWRHWEWNYLIDTGFSLIIFNVFFFKGLSSLGSSVPSLLSFLHGSKQLQCSCVILLLAVNCVVWSL